jgi:hypothetical protein
MKPNTKATALLAALAKSTLNPGSGCVADVVGQTASNCSPGEVRLEFNEKGDCTGRRVGDTVVPWMPKYARIENNTPIQNDEKTQRILRFALQATGWRWTQDNRLHEDDFLLV